MGPHAPSFLARPAVRGAVRVELWSDVVCPWCAIGRRRLREALRAEGVQAEVVHRAFELDPAHGPPRPVRQVLAERYGSRADVAQMMRRVRELGAAEGLDLRVEEALSASTFDAHRLVLWAQGQGKAGALLEGLEQAHFARAQDVSDPAVLLACVQACGLDAAAARGVLGSGAFGPEVRADEAKARALGIGGVPFFVFGGRVGVAGAQEVAVLRQAIASASSQTP